jgi:hypothetical protein
VIERDGRLTTQLDHVTIHRRHATITARRPKTGLTDDMIPTIDRGVFPLTEGGKDAANLVLTHWMSAVTRLVREPGRSRR